MTRKVAINWIQGLDRFFIVFFALDAALYLVGSFDIIGSMFIFAGGAGFCCGSTRFLKWAIPWITQGFREKG